MWAFPRVLKGQQAAGVRRLTDKLAVVDGGGANVLAFSADGGWVLVDSGAPNSGDQVMAGLKNMAAGAKVQTLFNTHYHIDQTGNNEVFAAAGAKIIAHERTREWMSSDYWVPAEDRYEKARPKAARPTETFLTTGSLKAGTERIDYGYLTLAHTNGDIYVFFKDVERSGGGRRRIAAARSGARLVHRSVDRGTRGRHGYAARAQPMNRPRIVPAYGPVMTRAEFKAERDVMEEIRARLFKQVREGDGPKDMLEEGVLKGLPRTWKDPDKFLYDACQGAVGSQ